MTRTTIHAIWAVTIMGLAAVAMLGLAGCPNQQQQTQIAGAALTASSTLRAAQQAEITMYTQGKMCAGQASCIEISDEDHHFIQEQFLSAATAGKTLDGCIRGSGSTTGAVACVDSSVTALDQVYASGGTYIKSAEARQGFQAAISACKLALTVLAQAFGGTKTT